jgi:pyruvate kinase
VKRGRKVKILATLGPSSSTEEMIAKLHNAGADVFRINMSHASHDLMRDLVKRIRAVEKSIGRPIGILADLQGPKLRVGTFANGSVELEPGQTFTLDSNEEPGDNDAGLSAASRNHRSGAAGPPAADRRRAAASCRR